MSSFKLTLEYDGGDFEGWQEQAAGRRTVQGVLRATLAQLAGAPQHLTGAGRTDAGVHAEGQVASVRLATSFDAANLLRALNARLPHDVAVRACAVAAENFDARRDARAKHYRYRVWNGALRSPLRRRRFAHTRVPLDVEAMARAAGALLGRHDFSSFEATGSSRTHSVRTLSRLEISGAAGGEIRFDFEGDGFLRHMVRNIVGTLLEVGAGRRAADSFGALLAARDRSTAGPTTPACGLTLLRVDYGAR